MGRGTPGQPGTVDAPGCLIVKQATMFERCAPLLLAAMVGACASAPAERDALGNPRLARLDPQALAALGPAGPVRLTLEEIVALSRSGVPPGDINDRIFRTGTRFALTDADRDALRQRGVSEQVISFIDSHERDAQRIDAATRDADEAAAARRARDAFVRDYGSRGPVWGTPGVWYPRVFPYAGYGWSRWGSGWYGGVGIGF